MERLLAVAAFQLFGRGRIWVFANKQIATYMASIAGLAETEYDEGQQEVRVILRRWVLEVI